MNKTFYALCACGFVFFNGVCEDRCKNISQIGKNFISEVREMQQSPEAAKLSEYPYFKWESEGKYNVVYSSKDYVSFKVFEWSYTGGAHGGSQTTVGTLKKGKILKLADLYRSPREKKQLEKILQVMLYAHAASKLRDNAKEILYSI